MVTLSMAAVVICFLVCLCFVGISLWLVFESGVPAGWWMLSIGGAWLMWELSLYVLGVSL